MTYEVYCLNGDCDFSATESDVQDADSDRRLHADQTGHRVEIQFEGEIRADGGLPYGDVAERDRILARLEELTDDGPIRMKARRIALGTSLSAVQIGQYLTNLPNEAWPTVDVEIFSRSNRATVWEVRPADEAQTTDAPDQELVTDGGSDVGGGEQPASTVDIIQWQDEQLEELDPDDYHVCDWWAKPEYFIGDAGVVDGEVDERSVSLVIRDEDDEILAEGAPYNTTGLYALIRVKDVPDDIPDRGEPPDLPPHVEWVHCEGPLAHKARAVRCVDCEEEFEFHQPKMPKGTARREPWTEIPHRASCEHAGRWGKQYWAELHMAQLISNRGTRTHTIGALWREADSLKAIRDSDEWGHLHDPVHERWSQIHHELVDRLQPRYPSCPECGETDWHLIEGRWPEECRACGAVASQEVGEAYDAQRQRVWGWRGHGDRSRGEDS